MYNVGSKLIKSMNIYPYFFTSLSCNTNFIQNIDYIKINFILILIEFIADELHNC